MNDEIVDPTHIIRADEFDEERMLTHGRTGTRLKGRLAGGVRDKLTMAEMKARIASLWKDSEDYTYAEIAEMVSDEFGLEGDVRLKANSVHYHIKSLIDYWKKAQLWSIDEKMARVQARWAQIEAIAENAYFASVQGKQISGYKKQMERARSKGREKWIGEQIEYEREEAKKKGEKFELGTTEYLDDSLIATAEKIEEMERTETNNAGDPRWVAHLITVNKERSELWNLKAHAEVANEDQEAARLPDDERNKRLVAVITSALGRKNRIQHNLAEPAPLGGLPPGAKFDEQDVEGLEF